MVFGHYCSGPDRSQRWSALYQFAESCSTLLCLSLTPLAFLVPGAETPAWYLFSYSASEVCTPFTSICWGPAGLQSEHFGSLCGGKEQCLQQRAFPKRRCTYTMSPGQIWAWCACLQLPTFCVEPKQKPHIHRSHCVELELISSVSWQDVLDQAYCCANCAYTASSLELAHLQLAWMVAKKARLCLQYAM